MHIHLSDKTQSPSSLLDSISGYLPLLYSIYNNRYKKNYSKAYKKDQYKNNCGSHHVAMNITSKTLEFRIFPAVESMTNLLWRLELIRLILNNKTSDHKEAFKNCFIDETNGLCIHLNSIFSEDKMLEKAKLFSSISKEIDELEVSDEVVKQAEESIKKIKAKQSI